MVEACSSLRRFHLMRSHLGLHSLQASCSVSLRPSARPAYIGINAALCNQCISKPSLLKHFGPASILHLQEVGLDLRVLAWTPYKNRDMRGVVPRAGRRAEHSECAVQSRCLPISGRLLSMPRPGSLPFASESLCAQFSCPLPKTIFQCDHWKLQEGMRHRR
jgi:hypothetical protein